MQSRLDPETGVDKPFKNVSCQGRRPTQNFFQGGAPVFVTFSSVIFFGRFKQLKYQKRSWGVRGHVYPGKFLKICILQWPF